MNQETTPMDEWLSHFEEAYEIPSPDFDSPAMKVNFSSNQSEKKMLSHFVIRHRSLNMR